MESASITTFSDGGLGSLLLQDAIIMHNIFTDGVQTGCPSFNAPRASCIGTHLALAMDRFIIAPTRIIMTNSYEFRSKWKAKALTWTPSFTIG